MLTHCIIILCYFTAWRYTCNTLHRLLWCGKIWGNLLFRIASISRRYSWRLTWEYPGPSSVWTITGESFQGPITRLGSVTPRAFLRARGSGSLRASSPGALAVHREKEEELATEALEFEFHLQLPCGSPSTELSDFPQSARSGNECETLKNTTQG